MTASWSLPGYEVQGPLGPGADSQVRRGLERATGRPVALRRLRGGADPAALRQAANLLRSLDTPYVVRLLAVVEDADATVLVLELAEGGSLAALLARRGALDPGEVVTIAVPLAQALAVAHDRGLVHGALSPSAVLFTADGMPLLDGLGTRRLDRSLHDDADHLDPAVTAGTVPTGASDVWSLASVCHGMLTGRPPLPGPDGRVRLDVPAAPDLVEALEAALVPDPALRPDAGALADALLQAHAAQPVRFHRGPPAAPAAAPPDGQRARGARTAAQAGPRHAASRDGGLLAGTRHRVGRLPRRLPRRLSAGAAGAVLLVGAAAVGVAWGQAGGEVPPGPAPVPSVPRLDLPPAPPSPAPAPAAGPAWEQLLDGLDAARAQAFATADGTRLAAVYAPDAAGLAADRVLVDRLAAAGRTAVGVRHELRSVEPLQVDGGRARLRVVDVLTGHEVLDAAGAVVVTVPAREQAVHLVDLARTPDGWRLVQVTPA